MPCYRTKPPFFIKGTPKNEVENSIIHITKSQGWFAVSLKYRYEWLNIVCEGLVKRGVLIRDRKIQRGQYIFFLKGNDNNE